MQGLIPQKLHAYIDYPVAAGLIVMPFALGLTATAAMLSVFTGFAALVLTALTRHETGLIKILPYRIHLIVDAMVGIVFVAAPFVLGFTGTELVYFLLLGGTVLAVVGLHREPSETIVPAE